jgi:hypothetical protein
VVLSTLPIRSASAASDVVRYKGSVACDALSANVLQYDHSNFRQTCLVRDDTGTVVETRAVYSASLGNLAGYRYDETAYGVFLGNKSFVGSVAGKLKYDKVLQRSYAALPTTFMPGFGPLLQAYAVALGSGNPESVPAPFVHVNVRDKNGCLAYSVDYSAFADFVPPAVGFCDVMFPAP